jgi:sugar lactone lactonase YvrE
MKIHHSTPFATGHQFLEALRWHEGALWASDFFSRHVLRFSPDGSATVVAEIPGAPSGLGFLDDGSVLVVSQADATILRIANDGTLSTYADFSAVASGPGNDLLVTPTGHAYVGNFGFVLGQDQPKPTNLAHVDLQQRVRRVDPEVLFPNGMAQTPRGEVLLAETFLHRISAFDVAPDGSLTNLRVWAQLDESYHPDGVALDTNGGVWFGNALTDGDQSGFYRVLEGGEITDRVPVFGAQAIACTFGGANLSQLYMSCNATTMEDFIEGRSTAVIAVADVGQSGAATTA